MDEMVMLETATERKRMRIVRHTISGFPSAAVAVTFGNTIERIIADKLGAQKFKKYIGTPETSLAITSDWVGETVLRTSFLGLKDDAMAELICTQFKKTVKTHNDVHRASIKIIDRSVVEKPQPQYIGERRNG